MMAVHAMMTQMANAMRTAAMLTVAIALSNGCQSTPARPSHSAASVAADLPPGATIDDAVGTDQRASRLNDIAGALLLYYSASKQMPAKLSDLAAIDPSVSLTAPDSGQPYGYASSGLFSPGRQRAVIVYEPTREPDGKRWCVMASSFQPGKPLSFDVLPLPEPVFLGYTPPQ